MLCQFDRTATTGDCVLSANLTNPTLVRVRPTEMKVPLSV